MSKSHTSDCSTSWAQGWIAAAINDQDDVKKHAEDTILNGHYICDNESVLKIIKQGKDSIDLLIKYGVEFNKNGEKLKQTLEGGH